MHVHVCRAHTIEEKKTSLSVFIFRQQTILSLFPFVDCVYYSRSCSMKTTEKKYRRIRLFAFARTHSSRSSQQQQTNAANMRVVRFEEQSITTMSVALLRKCVRVRDDSRSHRRASYDTTQLCFVHSMFINVIMCFGLTERVCIMCVGIVVQIHNALK